MDLFTTKSLSISHGPNKNRTGRSIHAHSSNSHPFASSNAYLNDVVFRSTEDSTVRNPIKPTLETLRHCLLLMTLSHSCCHIIRRDMVRNLSKLNQNLKDLIDTIIQILVLYNRNSGGPMRVTQVGFQRKRLALMTS